MIPVGVMTSLKRDASFYAQVIAASPAAYWRFEETQGTFYSEVGGYTATTSGTTGVVTPSGLGVLSGTPVYTNYVPGAVSAFSIEMFLSAGSATGTLATCRNSGSQMSLTLHIGTSPGRTTNNGEVQFGGDTAVYWEGKDWQTNPINNNLWHHVVATWGSGNSSVFSSSQVDIYINGVTTNLRESKAGTASSPNLPLNLNTPYTLGYQGDWKRQLVATYSEVAFYNRTLTPSEILSRAQALGVST